MNTLSESTPSLLARQRQVIVDDALASYMPAADVHFDASIDQAGAGVATGAASLKTVVSPYKLFFLAMLTGACNRASPDTQANAPDDPEPLAITRWTDDYELFVEFPPLIAGKPVPYHAHVTKLDGFEAATAGTFLVRFKTPHRVVAEAHQDGVKRPGIFVFEAPAPAAGSYTLEMAYEHQGKTDVFDCGPVTVTDNPGPASAEEPSAAITFLKESQWKIPFATVWAEERPIAEEIELAATVEPASTDQLTLAAPTTGRFFHDRKHAPSEGLRIDQGDILGTIAPTVAGDDFVQLQTAVEENRLAKLQADREIERISPLVQQGFLLEKRLIELRNERDLHAAKLRLAEGRLSRVTTPNGAGGIAIKSTLKGIISQVVVGNGEPVAAGAPLIRIGGEQHFWIRARFPARSKDSFTLASPSGARLSNGRRIDLDKHGAKFLSAAPVIEPTTHLATWIVDVGSANGHTDDNAPPLHQGMNVVLLVRTGQPHTAVTVPREAIVEINTQPCVFVQVDGEHFEKRRVTLGVADGGFVEVKSNVVKGERVVTRGGYDVYLAAIMGTVESHRH